jgi:nucleoid DNA-binding protein|tara:strand:- start:2782 stop:3315 length:534 start_codon:yes stop_codon:yes gene_type:complete
MAVKKGSAKATSTAKKVNKPVKLKTLSAAKKSTNVKKSTVTKASRKVAAKKPLTKKAPVKKAVISKTVVSKKTTAVRERFSKTQIISELAANSDLTRKQVNTLLTELATLVERHVKKRSVGEFVLAGLIKIHTVKRPAKKAYKGINPFTGKATTFKARPASVAVKVHALKGLKDMAQ